MVDGQGLRDWYLGALGIVQYLPRDAIDETGSQTRDSVPNEDITSQRLAEDDPPQDQSLQRSRPRIELNLDSPSGVTKRGQVAKKPASKEPEVADSLHCRLAFWQPAPDLAVLDSLEPGQRPSPEHRRMLANILKAIKRGGAELPPAELIDWPPTATAPADRSGARDMMSVFLAARSQQSPFAWVLLMGRAAGLVFDEPGTVPPVIGESLALPGGAGGVVTHSLSDMIGDPALKRDTWEAIRFLADKT
jgi:hypothetical protein